MIEHSDLLGSMRSAIENDLRQDFELLPPQSAQRIREMIGYHLGWKEDGAQGKRIRPLFTLLCCGAAGRSWENALPAASAIEWIHNFSLIHDDIQDQSATRRGRTTLWKLEGEAQAINTGDAVFALARLGAQRLRDRDIKPEAVLQAMRILDQACLDLTIGQHLDIDFENRYSVAVPDYMSMIEGKTGALVASACEVGAVVGGADPAQVAAYREFGRNVGLAFQMYDDLLGIWGESEKTGKPIGDDLIARKKTLPVLYGIDSSPDVKEHWQSDMAQPEQLRAMIKLLENSGAKDHVLFQAENFTQRAIDALEEAQPLQPYGGELQQLSLKLLKRVS